VRVKGAYTCMELIGLDDPRFHRAQYRRAEQMLPVVNSSLGGMGGSLGSRDKSCPMQRWFIADYVHHHTPSQYVSIINSHGIFISNYDE
jgi:hypothetical protein